MLKGDFPVERFRDIPTPFYYYDLPLLRRTLDVVQRQLDRNPMYRVHYAIKANFNPRILAEIAARGFGADCVSGAEVRAALAAGFPPEGIVFAGVGKSDAEIRFALQQGIARFNVESAAELEVIDEIAGTLGCVAPVSLRINPDIGAHTHAGITTGLAENKFGINYEQMDEVMDLSLSLPHVRYCGLHFHIGSQILDMMDYVALCNRINELVLRLQRAGRRVGDINVGGGLGINYQHPNHLPIADFEGWFEVFRKHLRLPEGTEVHFEPGRSLVAPCGTLIARVLYVKQGTRKQFAIIDGSMTELVRPAMYKAYHRVENLSSDEPEEVYDVVGPVCESSDVFVKEASIDRCRRGDLMAIRSAGAYGESMASHYNCHPLPDCFFFEG
jgi:diaminopimelate decarboxylase